MLGSVEAKNLATKKSKVSNYHYHTTKEVNKLKLFFAKEAKKKTKLDRRISNEERFDFDSELNFKSDAKRIIREISGGSLKTAAQVKALVDKYDNDANYDALTPQAKWMAAQIASAKPLKGIFVRLKNLLESQDGPMIHAIVVSVLRAAQAGVTAFNPDSSWEAGFDYMAKPYSGIISDHLIGNEDQLFDFVKEEVLPNLRKLRLRIKSLVFHNDGEAKSFEPFYFDNKVLFETMNPVSDNDRAILIDRGEVLATLSAINLAISGLSYSLAYRWDGLISATYRVGRAYGFYNNKVNSDPDKMTAKERIERIKDSRNLFKLKTSDVNFNGTTVKFWEQYTKPAWDDFVEGCRMAALSWQFIKEYGKGGRAPLLDPFALQQFGRQIDTSILNIRNFIHPDNDTLIETVTSSLVNGKTVRVKPKTFFYNPPRDLKDFLPIAFHSRLNGEPKIFTTNISGERFKYRNYKYGNPKGWKTNIYSTYFPDVKKNSDIPYAARVLTQTWGVGIFGAFLAPMLL